MAIATALPRLLMAAAAPAMTWLPLNVVIVDKLTTEVTARAHIARARSGLVLRRCPEIRYRLNTCKVAAVARGVLLSQSARSGMTRC